MSKRRYFEKHAIYQVCNRTLNGEALFTPTPEITRIIENNLAWAVDTHDIQLFGYGFQPDRFDLIIAAPRLNIPAFMGAFQGLLARQVNAHHGRGGQFYAGRYQDAKLGVDVQLERLIDILDAPATRGFVEHPSHWKGVSSLPLHESGNPLVGVRESRTEMRRILRANPQLTEEEARRRATTRHVVQLTPLHEASATSPEAYETQIARLAKAPAPVEAPSCAGDLESDPSHGQPPRVVGMKTIRKWPFHHRLQDRRPRLPVFLTRNVRRRTAFLKALGLRNLYYEWARERLRNGERNPRFPRGMIPLHKTRVVGTPPSEPESRGRADPH